MSYEVLLQRASDCCNLREDVACSFRRRGFSSAIRALPSGCQEIWPAAEDTFYGFELFFGVLFSMDPGLVPGVVQGTVLLPPNVRIPCDILLGLIACSPTEPFNLG